MGLENNSGPCPALEWEGKHYLCGLAVNPKQHIQFLNEKPEEFSEFWKGYMSSIFRFGIGCDSDIDDITVQPPTSRTPELPPPIPPDSPDSGGGRRPD